MPAGTVGWCLTRCMRMRTEPAGKRGATNGYVLMSIVEPFIQRVWPPALVGLGLSLSVAWTIGLGYGLFRLVEWVI